MTKNPPTSRLALRLLYGATVAVCAYFLLDSALSLRAVKLAAAGQTEQERILLLQERDALLARRAPSASATTGSAPLLPSSPGPLNRHLQSLAEILEILGKQKSPFESSIYKIGRTFYDERFGLSAQFVRVYGLTPEQKTRLDTALADAKTRIESARLRQASVRETEKQVVLDLPPFAESQALRGEILELFRSVMSEEQFLWFQMLSGPHFDKKLNSFGSEPVKYTLDFNDRGEPIRLVMKKPMFGRTAEAPAQIIPEFALIAPQLPPGSISDAKLTAFRGDLSELILDAKRVDRLSNAMRAELKLSSREAMVLYMLAHGGSQPKSFTEVKDIAPYFRDRADAEHFTRLYNKVLSETSR